MRNVSWASGLCRRSRTHPTTPSEVPALRAKRSPRLSPEPGAFSRFGAQPGTASRRRRLVVMTRRDFEALGYGLAVLALTGGFFLLALFAADRWGV